jgi:two-component system nitrogen regulation response regulator NtrX
MANGGTIFLDEIGDMSLMTQAKILRILQEHRFERVGGTETIEVNVRVIAATNKDLQAEMSQGRFREDLFYRLNVIPFHVPALRERREDIPKLAERFLAQYAADAGRPPKKLSPKALAKLQEYPWPGNVRELQNLIERLVLMTPADVIDVGDLPPQLTAPDRERWAKSAAAADTLAEARAAFEREWLLGKLGSFGWNISRTAEAVGLARESLSRKLKSLKIDVDAERARDAD